MIIDMDEKENLSYESLFLLIDISGREIEQKISLKSLNRIDIVDKFDIDLQKTKIYENEYFVLKSFNREDISGLLLKVLKIENLGERVLRLYVLPVDYIKIKKVIDYHNYKKVKCEKVVFKDILDENKKRGYLNLLRKNFKELSSFYKIDKDLIVKINSENDPFLLSEIVLSSLEIDSGLFYSFVFETDLEKRYKKLLLTIKEEIERKKLEERIYEEVLENIQENSEKVFLKEQLKIINRELGQNVDTGDEFLKLKNRILNSDLSNVAKEKALEEAHRLKSLPTYSPEYSIIKNYIDWILSLPWKRVTVDNFDIKLAKNILSKNHYGLAQVKERILEYLSVLKLSKNSKGHILCFVGAPGVGKTSLGQSIAQAMGRRFVRISLGGIKDESEIKGHRRTYVGAMPGRIIQMMKRAGVVNPVFMLDEIDKLGGDFKGDPSSAFLEILDPQINNSFSDNYLEIEYDLSKVLF
ncbi:TPA: endopeptidase La, partial [candidate division WOR-3]|nr:endopeptidase La [candidate division WOR-3 bacterium]